MSDRRNGVASLGTLIAMGMPQVCGMCGSAHRTDADWDEHDRRMELAQEQEERVAREEEMRRRLRSNRARLEAQGAPAVLLDLAVDRSWPCIVQLAHGLAAPGACMLMLAGPVGVGKTAATVQWLARTEAPYFVRASALATMAPWDRPWESAQHVVVDDVGQEPADAAQRFAARLEEVVVHCHGAHKRLVLSGNITRKIFEERYGARVASRWEESGVWRTIVTPDRRRNRDATRGTA